MVLEIGIQLAAVLDYLHNHQPPIIFRDVKPANIMRITDNHVYLIDFGIARHFKPGKAKDTIPLGSKGYAAPEQYGKAQSTPQTDIYGLGATLHELLTGDDPSFNLFHFKPVLAGKRKVLPIMSQFNALLEKMLEMEINKRPASMTVVKQELQSLLAQQAALSLSKTQAPVKRRHFLVGLASVVATVAITTYFVQNPNPLKLFFDHPISGTNPLPSPAHLMPEQAIILSRSLYTYSKHIGTVTAVAWSPKGQLIASAGALDGSVQVWDANTGNLVPLSRKSGFAIFATDLLRVDALAWSPNSLYVAAALSNDAVDVWSIETGVQTLLSFSQNSNVNDSNALAWSPNGSQIAAVIYDSIVQVSSFGGVNTMVNTREHHQILALQGQLLLYRGHIGPVTSVTWAPDGHHIASGSEDGTVQVWRAI